MESSVFFQRHLAQTTPYPMGLDIVSAKGIFMYDRSGKSYMDMVSGVGVSALGHGVEEINEAIKAQLDRHMHVMVYGEYLQDAQTLAAHELTTLLPTSLDCCYFVNSGTEANEAALKLAKRITGRSKIVSFRGAYHGSTHGSLSVSGNEMKKYAFRPLLPDVHFIRLNDWDDLSVIDHQTAGVILETIQGDAGIRIPNPLYLEALRKRCNEVGAQLIFDEIQAGMGRTGKMFAFEHYDVVPDILTLGKALGAGLPVGCVVSSTEKMKLFTFDPMLGHISTFAGHPVVCAAVAAGLQYMNARNVVAHVQEKGDRFYAALSTHPLVKEIRYKGLFFAIDLENDQVVHRVVEVCKEKGLIAFWFLSCPWSFRIAPPLVISNEEIDQACAIILSAMDQAFIQL